MNIDEMIRVLVAEATAPLKMEIRELREQVAELEKCRVTDINGLCEVEGQANAMKALGVRDHHIVADLLRKGVLGCALWKTPTQRGNGKVFCTPALAKSRYRAYLQMQPNVKEAWDAMGADMCERQWKQMQL